MLNVYKQITQNKLKSTLVIIFFIAFVSLIGYSLSYLFELGTGYFIFAIIFSLFSSFAGYFWGDKIVLKLNGASPASRQKYFNFYTVTENLSMANKTPMPRIYVINSPSMNAFATGRDPQNSVICATTGLLEKLNRTELEGVIGHELSHIKNYDIRLMMIVSMLIGTLSLLINMAYRTSMFGNKNDNKNGLSSIFAILGLILIIFAPLIAQLIQFAISRQREFLADASSVKLTRQPQGLIDALTKITQDPNIMSTASTATASLYISNPFKNNKLASLFSTHPPVQDRIRALQQML